MAQTKKKKGGGNLKQNEFYCEWLWREWQGDRKVSGKPFTTQEGASYKLKGQCRSWCYQRSPGVLTQGRQEIRGLCWSGSGAESEEEGTLGFSLPSCVHVPLRAAHESEMTETLENSVRKHLRAIWRLPRMVQGGDSGEGSQFFTVFL